MSATRKLCARSFAAVTLIACFGAVGALPAAASAAVEPVEPVGEAVTVDPPTGAVRGTMILVHGGGWAGHSSWARDYLLNNPGSLFVARGWRVVSLDHNEGTEGLQDVLNATGAELARKSSDGPVCLYGESSGAHLAVLAAARLSAVDCVIGVGTPTDLMLYQSEAEVSSDFRVRLVASQIKRFFGATLAETTPWELVPLAGAIRADVLLVHEADDDLVTAAHAVRFQAARSTTQVVELEAGDRNDPSTNLIHGTVSSAGRAGYLSALGSFADRAVAARDAERDAARTGCAHVTRSVTQLGPARLQSALRCLARRAGRTLQGTGRWQQTSFKLRGEVNAARVWAHLLGFNSGRHALAATAARRARVIVEASDRSRVTLRAATR